MRRFLVPLIPLLLLLPLAHAQWNVNTGGLPIRSGGALPSACAPDGTLFFKNSVTKGWYFCRSGAFVAFGTGSGSGTVTSVAFAGDGVVLSSTPSTAVTTSGNVTGALANAGANTVLGNFTGSPAAPTYSKVTSSQTDTSILSLSGAQSPTNKTFTSASAGNVINLLAVQQNTTLTGNAADQVLATFTIPAGTIGVGQGIRITTNFAHTVGSASVTYKVRLGGTVLNTYASTSSGENQLQTVMMNKPGSTTAQATVFCLATINAVLNVCGATFAPAINTSGSLAVDLTFNVAATDQVRADMFLVELIQ